MRALLLSFALLALAPPAQAGEADAAAVTAFEAHEENCADVAAGATNSATAEQQALVTDAWRQVITAYENTGRAYLLYWRGVLSQCLGQEDKAANDMKLFVELERFNDQFSALVKDAQKRLRRMKVEVREPGQAEIDAARAAREAGGAYSIARDAPVLKPARQKSTVPFGQIGLGAGYQRLGPFNYVIAAVDLSVQIKGPLRLIGGVRPGWSVSWTTESTVDGAVESATENTETRLLFAGAIGAELGFAAGPVRPRVAVLFQAAPNLTYPAEQDADGNRIVDPAWPEVLAGAVLCGGVDVPMGTDAIALRIAGEVGNLGPQFNAKIGGGFVVGLPGPRQRTR
jgi:hypothetical protein